MKVRQRLKDVIYGENTSEKNDESMKNWMV
jgi:hypothetical protein